MCNISKRKYVTIDIKYGNSYNSGELRISTLILNTFSDLFIWGQFAEHVCCQQHPFPQSDNNTLPVGSGTVQTATNSGITAVVYY